MAGFETHLLPLEATLQESMSRLNNMGREPLILFIADAAGHIAGTLTDGDIRRGLLRGMTPADGVAGAMNRCFTALRPGDDEAAVLKKARERNLRMLPRLDAEGRLLQAVDLSKVRSLLPLDAVLMAGGRGERLMPLTANTPKPLLKVGGKAIIDYNVAKLKACGIDRVYLCLRYLHEQIEAHFAVNHADMEAVAMVETMRMGTFGALSLITDWQHDDILVMNADLLSSLDLTEMYERHRSTGADATMAVAPYTVAVPFAIIDTDEDRITGMREKPEFNYYANAGVYILKRNLVERMPRNVYVDAPDFLLEAIGEGRKVSYFPIVGTWIDIGTPDQYARACALHGAKDIDRL